MKHLFVEGERLSGSKTLLSLFTLVAIGRYLLDGMVLSVGCDAGVCAATYAIKFNGGEAAAFLTPLAALHGGRRWTEAATKAPA